MKSTLVALLLSTASALASSSCVAFDASWNLYAFGINGKDYSAGTQDSWGSGSPDDITANGRPPFDTASVSCYLTQFYNAIYFLNADSANPNAIYIFDAAAKSWSMQAASAGPDLKNAVSILDHDTTVFFTLSGGQMWSVSLDDIKAKASSNSLSWDNVGKPNNFDGSNYQPVMGLAQNHIHFLNVPGLSAGQADIFVIHFAYWQPETQAYTGDQFPAQHGQISSFFLNDGVQQEFAFIPDDGSSTYVINVESNTTKALPGPSTKDASATYFASIDSLVQSSSSGGIQYLPYKAGGDNSGAKWTAVQKFASLKPASSGSSGPSGSSNGSSPTSGKPTGTTGSGAKPTTGGNSSAGGNSSNNGAIRPGKEFTAGIFGAMLLGSLAVFLL